MPRKRPAAPMRHAKVSEDLTADDVAWLRVHRPGWRNTFTVAEKQFYLVSALERSRVHLERHAFAATDTEADRRRMAGRLLRARVDEYGIDGTQPSTPAIEAVLFENAIIAWCERRGGRRWKAARKLAAALGCESPSLESFRSQMQRAVSHVRRVVS